MKEVILVKIGEVWLKGKNKSGFIDRLVLNIQQQTGVDKKNIKIEKGRIYILEDSNVDISAKKIEKELERIFGIHSFVLAQRIELDYELLKSTALDVMKKKIGENSYSFRVTTNRAFKGFEKNSEEVSREIGSILFESLPEQLDVNLENYDLNLIIEVRKEGIYLYFEDEEVKGAGGLPFGMSGKALMMLSGGIDSPVALWLLMKRGMSTDAVYFHSPPHTGDKTKEKIIDLCKILAEWRAGDITLYVPHFTEIQTVSAKAIPDEFWTLIHRRFMIKIADKIAEDKEYQALASGESLGQVASQTIENMSAVAHGAKHEILRPLVGFDKQETINIANKIGTYKTSILPFEDCCTVFSSTHPRTHSTAEELAKLEEELDVDELINNAMNKIEVYKINKDKIEHVDY